MVAIWVKSMFKIFQLQLYNVITTYFCFFSFSVASNSKTTLDFFQAQKTDMAMTVVAVIIRTPTTVAVTDTARVKSELTRGPGTSVELSKQYNIGSVM